MNTFKSTLLLVVLTLFLLFVGERIGGQNGLVLAFLLSVAFNFGTYFYSDKLALAMYRAQPVTRAELPRAYDVVERLTAKQGLPNLRSASATKFATHLSEYQRWPRTRSVRSDKPPHSAFVFSGAASHPSASRLTLNGG